MFKKIELKIETKYYYFYSNSKAEITVNESDTDGVLKSVYTSVISNIEESLGKGSGWIIGLVIIIILVFIFLHGSSSIESPKELNH